MKIPMNFWLKRILEDELKSEVNKFLDVVSQVKIFKPVPDQPGFYWLLRDSNGHIVDVYRLDVTEDRVSFGYEDGNSWASDWVILDAEDQPMRYPLDDILYMGKNMNVEQLFSLDLATAWIKSRTDGHYSWISIDEGILVSELRL